METTWFNTAGLADYGYVYYPNRCFDGTVDKCKVHMAMPACSMTQVLTGYTWMDDYGYG